MTLHDKQILFTALAFIVFITKEEVSSSEGSVEKILALAGMLRDFCVAHTLPPSPSTTKEMEFQGSMI